MNLLTDLQEPQTNPNEITIGDFRKIQYDDKMIKYFVNLCIEYLSAQNNNYLQVHTINIMRVPEYLGINDSHFTRVVVYTKVVSTNEIKIMFRLVLPTLLNDYFFVLNGNNYVPTLYVVDKPIVVILFARFVLRDIWTSKENSHNINCSTCAIFWKLKSRLLRMMRLVMCLFCVNYSQGCINLLVKSLE